MSDFSASQFLDDVQSTTVETKFTPVPTGDYPGTLLGETIKVEAVPFKDGNVGARFRAQWQLDGEIAGMKSPKVRQDFLLDIAGWQGDPQNGGKPILKQGPNQNVRLGRNIALSGQKQDAWSYRGLSGARGLVKVGHRPDKTDPETVYAEVVAVAALS